MQSRRAKKHVINNISPALAFFRFLARNNTELKRAAESESGEKCAVTSEGERARKREREKGSIEKEKEREKLKRRRERE